MKRIIRFDKAFLPAALVSAALIAAGIAGYVSNGGFNLGVDFQAGLMQEIQVAPTAFSMTYVGKGVASANLTEKGLDIVVSGSDVEKATHSFAFAAYPTLSSLVAGLSGVEGLSAALAGDGGASSAWLIASAQENPRLGRDPYAVHFLPPDAEAVSIDRVRAALSTVASSSVQVIGKASERRFMIRVQDQGSEKDFAATATAAVSSALDASFGAGQIALSRSSYVGARFSKNLTDQAFMLVSLTLLLILVYAGFRFKLSYAVGAVLAIAHDALIMVAFIAVTRMEFNTITIAAILTILGYSINDTIVIFDRIRETMRLYPDDTFVQNLNRSITETLGRTVITTVTTMLAVLSLFVFTSGSMKDFALALLVGMTSGVYSTIFIACNVVLLWHNAEGKRKPRAKKDAAPAAAPQKA